MFYFVLFLLFMAFGFTDLLNVSKAIRITLFAAGVLLLIFLGSVRWKTGTDWTNYYFYFKTNNTWKEFTNKAFTYETGYSFMNYLIKGFTDNYTILLLVLTFFTISIKSVLLYKNTQFFLIALFAYYCFLVGDIFSVRQSLAISICMFSIKYILDRKFFPFLITILLACAFHVTSFVFVFAYFLFYKRFSNVTIFVFLLIGMAIGLSGIIEKLLGPVGVLLNVMEGSEGGRLSEKMEVYSKNTDMSNSISKGTVLLIGMLRRLVFIPLYLFFRKKGNENDSRYDGYLNLFLFGNLIYFMFASSLLVMVRATVYYIVFEIFLIVIIMQSIYLKTNKVVIYVIISLYCLMKLYYNLSGYWEFFVPYYSIFEPFIDRKF